MCNVFYPVLLGINIYFRYSSPVGVGAGATGPVGSERNTHGVDIEGVRHYSILSRALVPSHMHSSWPRLCVGLHTRSVSYQNAPEVSSVYTPPPLTQKRAAAFSINTRTRCQVYMAQCVRQILGWWRVCHQRGSIPNGEGCSLGMYNPSVPAESRHSKENTM